MVCNHVRVIFAAIIVLSLMIGPVLGEANTTELEYTGRVVIDFEEYYRFRIKETKDTLDKIKLLRGPKFYYYEDGKFKGPVKEIDWDAPPNQWREFYVKKDELDRESLYFQAYDSQHEDHVDRMWYVPKGNPGGYKPLAVGGTIISIDKLSLLAPYIGLASTILVATVVTVVYVKRIKKRELNNG